MAWAQVLDEDLVRVTRARFEQGQRSVSIADWQEDLHRRYDPNFGLAAIDAIRRVRDLLREMYPCELVNDYCFSHGYSEVPITELAVAMKCTMLRSAGKPAAGLRRTLPDDRVFAGAQFALTRNAEGMNESAVRNIAEGIGQGLTQPDDLAHIKAHIRTTHARTLAIEPEARTARLLDIECEEPGEEP